MARSKESKQLRCQAQSLVGEDFDNVLEKVWPVSVACWRGTLSAPAPRGLELLLVESVPLFFIADHLASPSQELSAPGKSGDVQIAPLVPTLFFNLLCRALLVADRGRLAQLERRAGVIVTCRGPTSGPVMNGANLMIPGVTGVFYDGARSRCGAPAAGSTAFVHTIGVDANFAVGFASHGLFHREKNGLGVFIVHSFGDKLWEMHVNAFMVYCKIVSSTSDAVPRAFSDVAIAEDLASTWKVCSDDAVAETYQGNALADDAQQSLGGAVGVAAGGAARKEAGAVVRGSCIGDAKEEIIIAATSGLCEESNAMAAEDECEQDCNGEDGTSSAEEEDDLSRWAALFEEEDDVLDFCLCQAMGSVSPAELPVPLNVFSSILLASYPAYLFPDQPSLSFEKTRHKKALHYLQTRTECLSVALASHGVHVVERLDRSALLYRAYKRKYGDFIAAVHAPRVQQQRDRDRMAEIVARDDSNAPAQRFVSLTSEYRLSKPISYKLARALLGEETADTMLARTLGHGQLTDAGPALLTPHSAPSDAQTRLYSKQDITQNLRTFLSVNALLVFDACGGKGRGEPSVELSGAFVCVRRPNEHESSRVTVKDLIQRVLDLFCAVHQVSIEQVYFKNGLKVTLAITTKLEGACRKVHLSTNNKKGRMKYLCVRYLDALGFSIPFLTHFWSKRFSMQCWVRKNAVIGESAMQEVRVPFAMSSLVTQSLHSDLGLPISLIEKCF